MKFDLISAIKKMFNWIGSSFHELQPYMLTIIIFVVSAVQSILLWRDQGSTEFSKMLYSFLALGLDLAKFFFPIAAYYSWKGKYGHGKLLCPVYILLGVGCFVYSIIASMNFNLIEIQNLKSETYKTSQEYVSQQTYEGNKVKTIDSLEKSIAKLEGDRDSEISSLEKIRDEWDPAKYKDGKVWRQEEMQKAQRAVTAAMNKWEEKITVEKNKLNALRLEKAETLENTTDKEFGNSILFPTLEAQKNFFFYMSILVELVGIFAGVEVSRRKENEKYGKENVTFTPKIKPNNDYMNSPTIAKIGFKTNTNEHDKIVCTMAPHKENDSAKEESLCSHNIADDIVKDKITNVIEYKLTDPLTREYIDFVLDSDKYKVSGMSPGIIKIADGLNKDTETIRSVKKVLERAGFLEVVGKNTYVHSEKFSGVKTL